MRRRSRHGIPAVLAGVALVLLLLAAAGAGGSPAQWVKFKGDIDPAAQREHPTAVEFTAKMKKVDGKRVPKSVAAFKTKGVPLYCEDGDTVYVWNTNSEDLDWYRFEASLELRKRTFSGSDTDTRSDYVVNGTIPRKGPATGTVRQTLTFASDPETGQPPRHCDSGVVAWSAAKG